MEELKAAFLGLVQGVTEFLPISSSAHLLALEKILGFSLKGLTFDVSLHLATLLAVLWYFRREILGVFRDGRFWPVFLRLFLGSIPVGAAGFLLSEFREDVSPWVAVGGWTISGAYLLSTRGLGGSTPHEKLPYPKVLLVGLAQAASIFPGISRSGSTIASGLWLGLRRESAAEFSFFLAIPAMLGAGAHETLKILKSPEPNGGLLMLCAVGAPVAFFVGTVAIHVLLRIVRRGAFHRFGAYNLCAAAAFAAYLLARG
jgi:undecaprenyl-diphosphatase